MENIFWGKVLYRKINPKIYIETLEGSSSNGRIQSQENIYANILFLDFKVQQQIPNIFNYNPKIFGSVGNFYV